MLGYPRMSGLSATYGILNWLRSRASRKSNNSKMREAIEFPQWQLQQDGRGRI